jgi:hypothetical protein
LEEAETLPDITGLIDRAEVIRVAARRVRLSRVAQNDWAEYKLDAERKAGAELMRMAEAGERAGDGQRTGALPTVHELVGGVTVGASRALAGQWQAIAALPEYDYQQYKTEARKEGEITHKGAVRFCE